MQLKKKTINLEEIKDTPMTVRQNIVLLRNLPYVSPLYLQKCYLVEYLINATFTVLVVFFSYSRCQ